MEIKDKKFADKAFWTSWLKDLLPIVLLFAFAFFINRGIEIKGLYMDDLYLWSCYGEQSFLTFVFPLGSTRFRWLYNLAAWLELAFTGPHIEWIVPINIVLNALVAVTLFKMAEHFSRSVYMGFVCGIAFLASRMAYYQIAQTYGLMETLAMWLALGILYLLIRFVEEPRENRPYLYVALGMYFAVCFVHERYMVLIALFILVLIFVKCRRAKPWAVTAGVFISVQLIRLIAIGTLLPAGTGRTQVAETFNIADCVRYAISQVAYIFGLNVGPGYLNGQNFREAPVWIFLLIAVADLMLLGMGAAFVFRLIRDRKNLSAQLKTVAIFALFIACCIACSSVTIRLEMRWVYVSYAAALLCLSWMYGVLTKNMDIKSGEKLYALPYLVMITAYIVLMLPVEVYYRGMYPNLYFWSDQAAYNSLAEVTYGTYGDELFGKKVYIIGDSYDMSDFTEETFFRTFDRKREAAGTTVTHIDDIRDIGLITDDMIILQEDPAHDRFIDITLPARTFKCRLMYGAYDDGWIDENARIQVMAGSTGVIDMSFYYPGDITGEEWITVYMDDNVAGYLQLTGPQTFTSYEAEPFETVTFTFKTNFYVHNAQEQRGDDRLAAVLTITAD